MLQLKELEVAYGGIAALNRVSIEVMKGETALLVGANGAGKTSIINAVMGMVPVRGGSITFAGREVTSLPCEFRARVGIGLSPEGRRVFGTMSVKDNILVGMHGFDKKQQAERYVDLCRLFPLLAERAQQQAGQLSGGQQQVVAVARAMASSPSLLLLDEPFLGLAPVWIAQISAAIREIKKEGTTILMAEQMARPALALADRGYVIRGGTVRRSGSVSEIRDSALAEEYL